MSHEATQAFLAHARVQVPLICGAMYPCSNPELVAAVSEAGGLGVVQPLSLVYAHRYGMKEGLARIRELTSKPIGFNALIEASSKVYMDRMRAWVDLALEADVRFFVTALGNPRWVVDKVHAAGGVVYHDVVDRRWAEKALEAGVDGLICVNDRAGGHLGKLDPRVLFDELRPLGKPLICAGGIGTEARFREMLDLGYAGAQLGTRFIATDECTAHADYKQAIVKAKAADIVATDKISGVPVSVIKTPFIEKSGTKAGPLARYLLRGPRTKHWMRLYYSLTSFSKLKKASSEGAGYKDYWQAGKSVDGIDAIVPAGEIVRRFAAALKGS